MHFLEFGSGKTSILLAHGLFGSSTNWRGFARELSSDFQVFAVDLRNHGRSAHYASMTYRDMAVDLAQFVNERGLESVVVCGHSMGGKAAMVLSLLEPELVDKLIVLDIAPVMYDHSFSSFIEAMIAVDLESPATRSSVDKDLQAAVTDIATRQFLLQNLVVQDNEYRWRLNLPVLADNMAELTGFPSDLVQGRTYDGDVLFLYGEFSDYVIPAYHSDIERYFPQAQTSEIPGAGHWMHVDQPAQLVGRVRAFLA